MRGSYGRVLSRWRSLEWKGWWGDCLDVRFELAREVAKLRGAKVLDVGCGPGIILAEADRSNVSVGIDTEMDRLAHARGLCPDSRLVCADMRHLPFLPSSFDVLVLAGVIELWSDKSQFSETMLEMVRGGGRALITTPNREHWLYRDNRYMLSADCLAKVLGDWVAVRVRGYNHMPSLVWFLPAALKRHIPSAWALYLHLPSRLASLLPGARMVLRGLMGVGWRVRGGKWLFAEVDAPDCRRQRRRDRDDVLWGPP